MVLDYAVCKCVCSTDELEVEGRIVMVCVPAPVIRHPCLGLWREVLHSVDAAHYVKLPLPPGHHKPGGWHPQPTGDAYMQLAAWEIDTCRYSNWLVL